VQAPLTLIPSSNEVHQSAISEIEQALDELGPENLESIDVHTFIIDLAENNRDLVNQPYVNIINLVQWVIKRRMERKKQLLDKLYQRVPENLIPGSLYTTPDDLANSELTKYTADQIRYFFRTNQLPGASLMGRQIILTEDDVNFVLERERNRRSRKIPLPGPPPGTQRSKRGHQRFSETA
jgi:hypothetical protein